MPSLLRRIRAALSKAPEAAVHERAAPSPAAERDEERLQVLVLS
jgi:hypothetical protein